MSEDPEKTEGLEERKEAEKPEESGQPEGFETSQASVTTGPAEGAETPPGPEKTGRVSAVDLGLLVLRLGVGGAFVAHGVPKLLGGPPAWEGLGGAMETFGIAFWPAAWGFAAALTEALGGLLFALGLLFRPFSALLLVVMFVATTKHVTAGDGFGAYSHAMEAGFVFFGTLVAGPGKLALRNAIGGLRNRWWG